MLKMKNGVSESALNSATLGKAKESEEFKAGQQQIISP
jgi:hypothetical protein